MNHFITRKLAAQSLLAALMGLAGSSSMAATSWALDTCTNQNNTGSTVVVGSVTATNIGNSYQCAAASGTNNVTVTAYGSATSGSTTYGTASVIQNGADYGFGVGTRPEGGSSATPAQHTVDNDPTTGASDLLLLKFDTAVALGTVTIGWTTNDADFTIMAYTGSGTPTISGSTASAIGATAGWSLIQHVGDGTGDTAYGDTGTNSTKTVNTANVTASWWLISAYNASFGGTAIAGADTLKDYIKVMTVASKDVILTTNKTPEPTSLALVGLALAGAAGIRRRSKKLS